MGVAGIERGNSIATGWGKCAWLREGGRRISDIAMRCDGDGGRGCSRTEEEGVAVRK